MNTYPDQPGFAHALARLLAAAPDDRVRDGRRALALMQTLLQQQKTMALAETMAMTLAESGEYEQAVKWQRDAMAAAEPGGQDGPHTADGGEPQTVRSAPALPDAVER